MCAGLSERAHDAACGVESALREEIPEFETLQARLRCRHDTSTPVYHGFGRRRAAARGCARCSSSCGSSATATAPCSSPARAAPARKSSATLHPPDQPPQHQPFVAVSCALFSETLIESELFGHERGAFTGAIKDRPGRFELAEGGTIFLDDIDDVPLSMQVKLLRVLQNRTIERLGGTRTVPSTCASSPARKRDLKQLVAEGKFREDLYLPPQRAAGCAAAAARAPRRHPGADGPLPRALLPRARSEDVPAVSDAVRQAFMRYRWPGNVRELENACERIAQTCTCGTVRVGCMSASMLFRAGAQPAEVSRRPRPFPTPRRCRSTIGCAKSKPT